MYKLFFFFLLLSTQVFAFQSSGSELKGNKTKGTWREVLNTPVHLHRLKKTELWSGSLDTIVYGEHARNFLLIGRPDSGITKRKELIFFTHGGGWHIGKPAQHKHLASMLMQAGYTVVLPAYRLGPVFCYEDIALDLDAALRSMQEQMPIDSNFRIVFGGSSAGGNLAALLAFDEERLCALGIEPFMVRGFFSFAGALNLDAMQKSIPLKNYTNAFDSETFHAANPLHLIDEEDSFSSLIFHGSKDGMVDYQASQSFVNKLEAYQHEVFFYTLPKLSHLAATSKWYYKSKKDLGQSEMLLEWLSTLE